MRMKPFAVLAVLAAFALPARRAGAETGGELWTLSSAVYGVVGFAMPVGFAGIEGVHRFGSVFELSAGLGAGLSAALAKSGSPLQWAVMPRLRFGANERNTFTMGVGASGGSIGDIPLFCDEYCDQERASYPTHYWLWANFEVGGEHWWRNHFALRYFVGYAQGCQADSCSGSTLAIPYFGIGFGRAF